MLLRPVLQEHLQPSPGSSQGNLSDPSSMPISNDRPVLVNMGCSCPAAHEMSSPDDGCVTCTASRASLSVRLLGAAAPCSAAPWLCWGAADSCSRLGSWMRSCEKPASSGRLKSSSAVLAMPDCCAPALAAACCPAPLLPESAAARMTAAACLLMSEMVCRDPSSSCSLAWDPYA